MAVSRRAVAIPRFRFVQMGLAIQVCVDFFLSDSYEFREWPLCERFTILTQQIGSEFVACQVVEEGGQYGNDRHLNVIQRRRGF